MKESFRGSDSVWKTGIKYDNRSIGSKVMITLAHYINGMKMMENESGLVFYEFFSTKIPYNHVNQLA